MSLKPADLALIKAVAGKGSGGSAAVPNITMTAKPLPAGSAPTVTRSGSRENPVFELGIPAGADSETFPTAMTAEELWEILQQ